MLRIFSVLAEVSTTLPSVANPLLDENGDLVSTEEAVSKFSQFWQELDPVNKLISAVPKIIVAVLIILIGFWLSKFVSNLSVKAMKARGVDASVYKFVKNMISFVLKFLFLLFALSLFFNVNSFFAAIGALGITAGMGLKDSIAQFASGLQILFNKQFKLGDYISVDGQEGCVAEIRFMNTVIVTPDNKRVIIPNSHITTGNIVNFSAEGKRRLDLNFSVSYSQDIGEARDVILDVVKNNPDILTDPQPAVFVMSHEESCINLVTRIWCNTEKYWDVYFYMQEEIKYAFDKNSIEIPFNQLDVHMVENASK
ncbi:MAG: mechanosensitive ion channel family protein [Acutalibacteraceae bacterium]